LIKNLIKYFTKVNFTKMGLFRLKLHLNQNSLVQKF